MKTYKISLSGWQIVPEGIEGLYANNVTASSAQEAAEKVFQEWNKICTVEFITVESSNEIYDYQLSDTSIKELAYIRY